MTTPIQTGIDDKTLLLAVDFKRFGQRRTLDDDEYEVKGGADQEMTSASAKRLDSKQLLKIQSFDNGVRRWLERKSLPSLLKPGIRRVPKVSALEIIAGLAERKEQRADLIAKFVEDYPAALIRTKAKLNGLFHASDYPKPDAVAAEFSMAWRFLASGVPDDLAAVSPDVHAEQVEAYKASLTHAADAYKALLRVAMADLVDHLLERLTPSGADGKKHRFHMSNVVNLQEFLAEFSKVNVSDDKELAVLVSKADAILTGVAPEDLKDDEGTRAYLKAQMAGVKAALDPLVVSAKTGHRKIVFDEAEKVGA